MRRQDITRRCLLAGLTAAAGLTLSRAAVAQQPAPAQPPAAQPAAPQPNEARTDRNTGAILVPLGSLVRYDTKSERLPTAITVANDEIVIVSLDRANPRVLVLTGKQAGTTTVTLTFEGGGLPQTLTILVQPDIELLRKVIRQTVPTANVEVTPGVGGVLILSGYVNKPEESDLVARIASAAVGGTLNNIINGIQVGGSQHVLIDVTVAQVDRTELRERGFSFGVNGTSFGISSVLGGLAVSNTATGLFGGATGGSGLPPVTPTAQANVVFGIVPGSTLGALRALRTEGVAKFLSEPKVITQTGRPALLRAGGQQAVLGPASGINGPGVQLEQVGTQLEVLPIVFGNGRIYLEVTPQFRSVNIGRGVTTAFGFTPGFNESSVRSSVMMESGQTYAIGGLLETQSSATVAKVPYLGDLPFVGTAFSNISHDERETELVFLVTPRLVDALDCNQAPRRVPGKETRSPDDYELFLESLVEAPRGQRQVFVNGKYVPAYKNSPTYGQFPCIGGTNLGGGNCGNNLPPLTPVTPAAGSQAPAPMIPAASAAETPAPANPGAAVSIDPIPVLSPALPTAAPVRR